MMLFWLALAQIRFEAMPPPGFVLRNHATADKQLIETMPGGVGVFDYNGDGRPDLFFANGAAVPSLRKEGAKDANRLYRNDGNWKFTDVTESAGVAGEGYAMGVAAGDFDGDGHVDLFVAGVYRNQLLRNLGNGKFEDVTSKSKIKSDEWSVAAGWFDYDGDGRLDLLVANYGKWTAAENRYCGDSARHLRVYCHPKYFAPRPNQLYRNLGDGTFEDVSVKSGMALSKGRGMAVVFADYDGDGRLDAFVTNDNLPNFLFHNLGGGKFEEVALLAGVALLDHGRPVASMGADFRDYDGDGRPDIVVTALNGETFPVFRNQGDGTFRDQTFASQVARLTNTKAGWGVGFVDFDNDGALDLFTANSHVNDLVDQFEAAAYLQANSVFRQAEKGKFAAVENSGLEKAVAAHRGCTFADVDGDGRVDAIVTVLDGAVELWRNVSPAAGHWLVFDVPLGTQVEVDGRKQRMMSSLSYASSAHAGLHFGLGPNAEPRRVVVTWPSGKQQVLEKVAVDQRVSVPR
ncbi:MAG: CRTAC1 family protein [Bryobacteraceae bacterium]|nr:CRTAC1 family protein [Bryobacteraceae bacterium]